MTNNFANFIFLYSRHFGNRHFGTVDIMGVDILGKGIIALPHHKPGIELCCLQDVMMSFDNLTKQDFCIKTRPVHENKVHCCIHV